MPMKKKVKDIRINENKNLKLKNIKKNKGKMNIENAAKIIRLVVLVGISLVIFIAPFIKGLFFEADLLPIEIFTALLFILYWVFKYLNKKNDFLVTALDYASFAFVIVYLISLVAAVSLRLAISEWLKYLMYFTVFIMVSDFANTIKSRIYLLCTFVFSAVGVSIIGIDGAAGGGLTNFINRLFIFLGSSYQFRDTFFGYRIYSTLQYPNTLGSYLIAAFLVSLCLKMITKERKARLVLSTMGFLLLLTFVFTFSRGAYITMAGAIVLLFVIIPRKLKIMYLVYLGEFFITVGIIAIRIYTYIQNPQGIAAKVWLSVLVGMIITLLFALTSEYVIRILTKISYKIYISIVTMISVLTLVVIIFSKNVHEFLLNILHSFISNQSITSRASAYKDAIKIFVDHWFLGSGGGGWQSLYHQYQSYGYNINNTHNYVLQLAVECGILGLMALICLSLFLIIKFSFHYIKTEQDLQQKIVQSVLITTIIAMFLHSLVDIDFSMSAIFLILWVMLGILNSYYRNEVEQCRIEGIKKEDELNAQNTIKNRLKKFIYKANEIINIKPFRINAGIGLLIAIILFVMPFNLWIAMKANYTAVKQMNNGKAEEALVNSRMASTFDFSNPVYKINYINALQLNTSKSDNSSKEIIKVLSKIDKLVKGDYEYYDENNIRVDILPNILKEYFTLGDITNGLRIADKMTKVRPLLADSWEVRTNAYYEVLKYYNRSNNEKSTKNMFSRLLSLVDEAKNINKNNFTPFIFTPRTNDIIEKVQYTKNAIEKNQIVDMGKCIFYGIPQFDIDNNGIPDQWVEYNNGKNLSLSYNAGMIKVENHTGEKNSFIQSRNLFLFAGKKEYRIEVELYNPEGVETIPYYLYGISKTEVNLIRSGNLFAADIDTPDDFSPDINYLLLGANQNYMIKSVKILMK